jgi:hypothetical protein
MCEVRRLSDIGSSRVALCASAHIKPGVRDPFEVWVNSSNDVASFHVGHIFDCVSAFDLGQKLIPPGVVYQEEHPPSNFLGFQEKSLLDMLISRDRVAPEMTDSSSGNNVRQRQLKDDVAEQLRSEEHRMCGGLARVLGDGACVRRLQRARRAALGDFDFFVHGVHGVCDSECVRRVALKVLFWISDVDASSGWPANLCGEMLSLRYLTTWGVVGRALPRVIFK